MSSRFSDHTIPAVRVIDLYHEDQLNRIWLSDQQRFLKRRPNRWQRFLRWLRGGTPRLHVPGGSKKWK